MELLKGPIHALDSNTQDKLVILHKLKEDYETAKEKNFKYMEQLDRYYNFDTFEEVGSDLIARDLCLLDSAMLAMNKGGLGRVESNILLINQQSANLMLEKRNPTADYELHQHAYAQQKDVLKPK